LQAIARFLERFDMKRIGVIGAGKIGAMRAQTLRANPETEIAAVFDINEAAAREIAGAAPAATSLAAFFETPMDAVVISTPPHLHEEAALMAFARGVHVLCEKPMSNTVEGARRIVDAAIRARRALGVGFNFRFYPHVKFVRHALDSGELGPLDHVRVFGGHGGLHNFSADWQYKMPLSGGGAMMDVGIHISDLARYFLGEITEASGVMTEAVYNLPGSEDNAVATYRSPSGAPCAYHATWTEWKGYQTFIEVYGRDGMARGAYAPMHGLVVMRDGKRRENRFLDVAVREKLKTWKSTAIAAFAEELSDFLRLMNGETGLTIADGHDGLRSIELAAAVRASTGGAGVVRLPALGRMPAVR
jgi:predicted dehydrogenase